MSQNNHDNILTGSFTQYGINIDEMISKSKVVASYNRSYDEIQNAQKIELQQISDLVINEKENLVKLNRQCEKYNFRQENKLEMAMKSQNSLITDMNQVINSFIKLRTVIDELDTFKTTTEQRNNEINLLCKTIDDIQHVQIPEINHNFRVLNEQIHNIQSNNKSCLVEIEDLKSEENTLSLDLTSLRDKEVKLENLLKNAQQDFIDEQSQNSKLMNNRNELQKLIQEKTNNLTEMKQKFEVLSNDTISKLKIDFKNEIENEKLKKINIAKRIATEYDANDLRLKKLEQELDQNQHNLRTQIEHYKNKRAELQKSVDFANTQRINEQKLIMDKTKRIEALNKQKLELANLLQHKELENNELDGIHHATELEIQNVINNEVHEFEEKINALELNNKALRHELVQQLTPRRGNIVKRISLPQRCQMGRRDVSNEKMSPLFIPQTPSNERISTRKSPKRLKPNTKRSLDNSHDDMSFLSNMTFGSALNHESSQFKFPLQFVEPLMLRNKKIKSSGIPKPKEMIQDPFDSSDDSS